MQLRQIHFFAASEVFYWDNIKKRKQKYIHVQHSFTNSLEMSIFISLGEKSPAKYVLDGSELYY